MRQLRYLRVVLNVFEVVLGLLVNWSKGSFFRLNIIHDLLLLATILGCQTESLPILGIAFRGKTQSKINMARNVGEVLKEIV